MSSRGQGGRNTYVSHLAATAQTTQSAMQYLRNRYPDFYRPNVMRSRAQRLHRIHEIGRLTGFNPETGRKYQPPKKQERWFPKSGEASTAKGREAQDAMVGFGSPKKKRKKRDGSPGGDDDPPGPGLPVSRSEMQRVKVVRTKSR